MCNITNKDKHTVTVHGWQSQCQAIVWQSQCQAIVCQSQCQAIVWQPQCHAILYTRFPWMGDSHSAKRYYIHGFLEWVTVTVPSVITFTVSLNGWQSQCQAILHTRFPWTSYHVLFNYYVKAFAFVSMDCVINLPSDVWNYTKHSFIEWSTVEYAYYCPIGWLFTTGISSVRRILGTTVCIIVLYKYVKATYPI